MNTATKTLQTPAPSPGPSPRRNKPPPPLPQAPSSATAALSPSFSRAPFRTRLGAAPDDAAASSSSPPDEHPCVTLWDWWLERVEGDERKIAVAGFTERNDAFTSAPIAKRYEPLTLEDEDGVVVLIHGSLSISRMRENGFSLQICEKFLIGFPYWWDSWDSHMESQLCSSSNPRDGSTQFYLEKFQLGKVIEKLGSSFIGNLLSNAKKFPTNDADAFKGCSRFEEYTSRDDISTKEISAASNDGSLDKEVDNVEIDLIASSTSHERGHADIECDVSLAPTEKCTSYETYVEAGNQKDTMHPDAREQVGHVDIECDVSLAPTEKCSSDEIYVEAGNQNDTMHPDAREREGHVDVECNVSLAPTEKFTGGETYIEAGNQNDTMHPDGREQEAGSHLVNSDLICNRSPDHMPSDLEHRNTKAGNSVGLVSKYLLTTIPPERSHCCSEITGALENLPQLSCERTSVASSKNEGCLRRTKHIASNQKVAPNEDTPISVHSDMKHLESHVVPAKEQRSPHVTRSPMIRSTIPYAHHSPLTRGKAKSLCISTPESLKMKRTRSGRVVVPPLDHGSEWIVYDMSGFISGVGSTGLQSPLKGSKSGTPASARKRKAR